MLTKPLGTGIIATAIKRGVAEPAVDRRGHGVHGHAQQGRLRGIALAHGVHAMTDVTGFGLLGHLREMCAGSGLSSAELWVERLPWLPGAVDLVR